MRSNVMKAALALATAAAAFPALAADQPRPAPQPMTRAAVQQKIAETFARLDTNRDGAVTQAEYDAARTAMRTEWQGKRFAKLDKDGNGQISREEFAARGDRGEGRGKGMRGHWRHHGGGMGRFGNFAMMDTNKDGRVTLAEASARPLAMFDAADTNHDGTVTPEERQAARAAMLAKWQAKRN